ncbi:GNAT family N-acetyltransferase [Mycobacterium lehmannii]|uniref:GNAT family N-acetyltransferase n=1 Tax=Mycobacterium lehmannii TaxID=2048550 RepID=UPI000B93E1AB|nr:GNAT family N-acetyltransferase [Mycobacterium lehmannii]
MGRRNRVTIGAPRAEDFDKLPTWFTQAGVASNDPDAEAARYRGALTDGYLGVATAAGFQNNLRTVEQLPNTQWAFARLMVRVLRLNDTAIGAVIMGSHVRLWELLGTRMNGASLDLVNPTPESMNYMIGVLKVAKIHLLAVDPDQQGRGHGGRLLRSALDVATRDGLVTVYGQFSADRPHLAGFYERAGFTIGDPGEPMSLTIITGNAADAMEVPASHRLFVREQPPAGR